MNYFDLPNGTGIMGIGVLNYMWALARSQGCVTFFASRPDSNFKNFASRSEFVIPAVSTQNYVSKQWLSRFRTLRLRLFFGKRFFQDAINKFAIQGHKILCRIWNPFAGHKISLCGPQASQPISELFFLKSYQTP